MDVMSSDPHAQRDGTVELLIARADRTSSEVPLRHTFVQGGTQRRPAHGPLHQLLRHHDERALDLYLLQRYCASSEPWDVRRDARIWARALGLPTPADNGASAVSKVWARLDDTYRLVKRERSGRLSRVTALDESGDRSEYHYPSGRGPGRYFKLSAAFWLDDARWYRTLSLRAKVMLLVASTLKPRFALPVDQIPAWYGISIESGSKGLRELEARGLLRIEKQRRDDLLSPEGYVIEHRHTLLEPLAQDWQETPLATVTDLPTAGAS